MKMLLVTILTSSALALSAMAEENLNAAHSLQPETSLLTMSAVKGHKSRVIELKVRNEGKNDLPIVFEIGGKDAASFRVIEAPKNLRAKGDGILKIAFYPANGARLYQADLQIEEANVTRNVEIRGIGLDAFEGNNEPPLQQIVTALGIPLKVGGETLSLNSEKASIGESVDVSYFRVAEGKSFQVRPLARFSPAGETPIGLIFSDSKGKKEIGRLMVSTPEIPDAHQSVFPLFSDGNSSLKVTPSKEEFGFYMDGHHYVSFTDPARQKDAQVKRTARVYPVKELGGKVLENAWMVCFEEAKNGDYQDVMLLIENVAPVKK